MTTTSAREAGHHNTPLDKGMNIRLSDYPQLQGIAWNRAADASVDPADALALYERNWRYVDAAALTPAERELISRLIREVGNGGFNV